MVLNSKLPTFQLDAQVFFRVLQNYRMGSSIRVPFMWGKLWTWAGEVSLPRGAQRCMETSKLPTIKKKKNTSQEKSICTIGKEFSWLEEASPCLCHWIEPCPVPELIHIIAGSYGTFWGRGSGACSESRLRNCWLHRCQPSSHFGLVLWWVPFTHGYYQASSSVQSK